MKVVMLGSWEKHKAAACMKEAEEIGKLLAEQGHILVSGRGTGVSEFVVNSYRKHKGKQYICYRPAKKYADKVGEELGPKPDKLIDTNTDYPERNLIMIRDGDAMLALHGGLGTMAEIIEAVKDYNKKVSVIDFGDLANWIRAIPELHKKVLITKEVKEALKNLG
jgi:uncharacterized protein (TIGR00725 family)